MMKEKTKFYFIYSSFIVILTLGIGNLFLYFQFICDYPCCTSSNLIFIVVPILIVFLFFQIISTILAVSLKNSGKYKILTPFVATVIMNFIYFYSAIAAYLMSFHGKYALHCVIIFGLFFIIELLVLIYLLFNIVKIKNSSRSK